MVMLPVRLIDRLFAFWAAAGAFTFGLSLIYEYRHPGKARGIPKLIIRLWHFEYRNWPRTYMLSIGVICLLIGLLCVVIGLLPVPSNRPPLFRR
jgi:H+/Cl- antiporter ClcA